MQHLEDEFVPYARADEDSAEEQVHAFMDRTLQYRVELLRLYDLAPQRFSHVSLRYTFFREVSSQAPRFRIGEDGDTGALGLEFRHVAEVSDALVKYVTDSNLAVEVRARSLGRRSPPRADTVVVCTLADPRSPERVMHRKYCPGKNVQPSTGLKSSRLDCITIRGELWLDTDPIPVLRLHRRHHGARKDLELPYSVSTRAIVAASLGQEYAWPPQSQTR
jgi:hypothetical protein